MILDGIRYRIFSTGCIVGIMGLFLAIVSVVHDKKYLAASFLSLAFSLIYVTSYLYVLMNPLINILHGKIQGKLSRFKDCATITCDSCLCIRHRRKN